MKKTLGSIFTIAVGFAVLAFVLRRVGLGPGWSVLAAADLGWVALGVFVLAVPMTLLKAYRWHRLLRSMGADLPYPRTVWACLVGNCGAFVTPGQMGDLYRAYVVSKSNFPVATGVWSVLWDRLLDVWGLTCVTCVAALLTPLRSSAEWMAPLASCAVVGTVALLLLHRLRPMLETLASCSPKFRRLTAESAWPTAPPPLDAWLWSLLGQALLSVRLAVFAISVGITTGLPVCAFLGLIANLIAYIPITVNGLGTREAALVFMFEKAGHTGAQALAFSFLIIASWALNAVLGYLAWLFGNRWFETPAREAASAESC